MISLKEYRETKDRLSDHLPWAMAVAPGVILQKGGILQATFRFRGPDIGTASYAERDASAAHLNNAFRRLGGEWSLFVEAQRLATDAYPRSEWPTDASFIVDEERARHFSSAGMQFESHYFLTICQQLPSERAERAASLFYRRSNVVNAHTTWRRQLEDFQHQSRTFIDLVGAAFPLAKQLTTDETLSYLHSTISTQRHPVRAPRGTCYLDALLPDEAFQPSELPLLGEHYLGVSTVTDFPGETFPGLLDQLNHLHLEYRWMTRWLAVDADRAKSTLKKHRRLWFRSQKGLHTSLLEQASGSESRMVDESASDNADDAGEAQRLLGSGEVAFGYMTTTFVVWDRDPRVTIEKQKEVKKVLQRLGFVVRDESFHAWQAWIGSLPGHCYAGVRRPMLHTRNLADLIPASAVWAGEPCNDHLARVTGLQRAHIYTTTGSTPFRVNSNSDDLGNMAIFGPPGSGKSTLLAMLGLQILKFPGAQVIQFDVHRSGRAAALANGGVCYEPGDPNAPMAFQPLAAIDDPAERIWAATWLCDLLTLQHVQVTPAVKHAVNSTLEALALQTPERRTLTIAADDLGTRIPALREALRPYTLMGNYGQIFDAAADSLQRRTWTLFEMSHLMNLGEEAILPALAYLIHRIEHWFDGKPTLLMLDECWRFMSHPMFANWFQKSLKTLRKKNVYVYFATQEVADLARHQGLVSTVLSACPSLIFGADEAAATPTASAVYRSIGLTDKEINLLVSMQRKQDYYYRSTQGRRVFSLSLGATALAFAGMSSPDDQRFLDAMVATRDPNEYALAMLEHRGIDWAAAELRNRARGRVST